MAAATYLKRSACIVMSLQDLIWNRACLERGGATPHEGDRALAALLLAHGLVMNGGVLHALGCLSRQERIDAIAGYRYFGLVAAADVLTKSYKQTGKAEEASNSAYWHAVPDDDALADAFHTKLAASPGAFAPTAVQA